MATIDKTEKINWVSKNGRQYKLEILHSNGEKYLGRVYRLWMDGYREVGDMDTIFAIEEKVKELGIID